jgi:hypothetical protein
LAAFQVCDTKWRLLVLRKKSESRNFRPKIRQNERLENATAHAPDFHLSNLAQKIFLERLVRKIDSLKDVGTEPVAYILAMARPSHMKALHDRIWRQAWKFATLRNNSLY